MKDMRELPLERLAGVELNSGALVRASLCQNR